MNSSSASCLCPTVAGREAQYADANADVGDKDHPTARSSYGLVEEQWFADVLDFGDRAAQVEGF